jgi:arylsulfatase A-like enzyme
MPERSLVGRLSLRAAAIAIGRAWLDASLAGVIAAIADLILTAMRGGAELRDVPMLALVMIGLCAGVFGVVGAPLVLALRVIARLEPLAGSLSRLRAGGPGRVEVFASLACGALILALLGRAAFAIVVAAHARFNDPEFAAVVAAALIVVVVVVVAFVFAAVSPPIARWLGGRRIAVAIVSGRPGAILLVVVAATLAVAADAAIHHLAPAWDPWPTYVVVIGALVLLVAAATGPAARLGQRWALPASAAVVSAITATLLLLGHADRVTAIMSRSAIATHVHMMLVAQTDGDGDGIGDGFGGHDCDDTDARVHPLAREIAGNGRDENCVAGDADPRRVAERRGPRQPAKSPASRPDIVLITIDSLRADHTSLHGYARATTPNLAALAARSSRFDRAITPSPSTRRAIPALLFGRHASTLPFEGRRPVLAAHSLPSLPGELARAGYRTGAITSHQLPLSPPTFAGFDDTIVVSSEPVSRHHDNADDVVTRAIEWLARDTARPRFAWIHVIDPHHPYEPRTARFGPGKLAGYDASIAFVDEQLARLLATIDLTRTVVVVTADHGDAFGEHGTTFHGRVLDEEETHVPLVISVPGAPAQVIGVPMSLIDLAPTLLELAGVLVPAGMTGASYAAALRGGFAPQRPVLAELLPDGIGRPAFAAWLGDRKIIRDIDTWTMNAYDLTRDPREQHPLSHEVTVECARTLDALVDLDLALQPGER